jgi:glycosyltransferase involved in cell wall biosynthesis
MIKFANSLASRGWSVRLLYLGDESPPEYCKHAVRLSWTDVPSHCVDLDCLLCPGDLGLWQIAPRIGRSCRLIAVHLHFGVHHPRNETRNAKCRRIIQATTAEWIKDEIAKFGVLCTVIGAGPLDDDLCEVPASRDYRIGTLAHADYGWKNSRAAAESYFLLKQQMDQIEFWSYGVKAVPNFPGRFFLLPDLETRRMIYSSCRVWIAPSISEGLGMTAFEAMQCRAPVVATDNRGIREYADHSTCWIVRPSRPQDMIEAVRKLLLDWPLGQAMARRAHDRIAGFSWSTCIERLERIIEAPK